MTDPPPRSSYESDWLPYTKVTGRSAVRAAIGEELKRRFEFLQPVPQEMLALLVQVKGFYFNNLRVAVRALEKRTSLPV